MYNIYYPEDIAKEPIRVVFHKDKFYQFFHSNTIGNPYLGVLLKKANQYEFQDNVLTEEEDEGAKEQLTLQICNSLVTINQGQPGSPERTREPWASDRMPTIASATTTITPTTYSAQQTQSQLPMATETIMQTLTESTLQYKVTHKLAQPSNGSR